MRVISIFVFTLRFGLVFVQIWRPDGNKSFRFHKVLPNHAYNIRVFQPKRGSDVGLIKFGSIEKGES